MQPHFLLTKETHITIDKAANCLEVSFFFRKHRKGGALRSYGNFS